jgi:hypothetical protein
MLMDLVLLFAGQFQVKAREFELQMTGIWHITLTRK